MSGDWGWAVRLTLATLALVAVVILAPVSAHAVCTSEQQQACTDFCRGSLCSNCGIAPCFYFAACTPTSCTCSGGCMTYVGGCRTDADCPRSFGEPQCCDILGFCGSCDEYLPYGAHPGGGEVSSLLPWGWDTVIVATTAPGCS